VIDTYSPGNPCSPPEPASPSFVSEASRRKETPMNRNVTIGLGTLIVIIIIVALVF
jgi:hypothetical protein